MTISSLNAVFLIATAATMFSAMPVNAQSATGTIGVQLNITNACVVNDAIALQTDMGGLLQGSASAIGRRVPVRQLRALRFVHCGDHRPQHVHPSPPFAGRDQCLGVVDPPGPGERDIAFDHLQLVA